MKQFITRMLPLFLIMSLFAVPSGTWANSDASKETLIDGGDLDEIYDYEKLEAAPLDMALFPKPIKNFDINFTGDRHVSLSLETNVPVSLSIKSSQPAETLVQKENNLKAFSVTDPITLKGQNFTDVRIPVDNYSNLDLSLSNEDITFSTTIQIRNGEILNKISLFSEYTLVDSTSIVPFASNYESEANNTAATADLSYNGDDNYGNFSTTSDTDDWWKFTLNYRAYVNFFLGNIPSGSDYDLYLYSSSNTTTPIWSGTNAGNSNELDLNRDLEAGTYYLKVNRYSGSNTTSYYNLRWKINKHWPVLWTTTVNSGYKPPGRPTHLGIDINYTSLTATSETNKCNGGNQCYRANNIAAAWDGTVSRVDNPANESTGYGRVVYINHNIDGTYYQTRYAHLHSSSVSVNDTVKAGDVIGVMGNTGGVSGTTGTHLHFEVRTCTTSACTSTTDTNPMLQYPGY